MSIHIETLLALFLRGFAIRKLYAIAEITDSNILKKSMSDKMRIIYHINDVYVNI